MCDLVTGPWQSPPVRTGGVRTQRDLVCDIYAYLSLYLSRARLQRGVRHSHNVHAEGSVRLATHTVHHVIQGSGYATEGAAVRALIGLGAPAVSYMQCLGTVAMLRLNVVL